MGLVRSGAGDGSARLGWARGGRKCHVKCERLCGWVVHWRTGGEGADELVALCREEGGGEGCCRLSGENWAQSGKERMWVWGNTWWEQDCVRTYLVANSVQHMNDVASCGDDDGRIAQGACVLRILQGWWERNNLENGCFLDNFRGPWKVCCSILSWHRRGNCSSLGRLSAMCCASGDCTEERGQQVAEICCCCNA